MARGTCRRRPARRRVSRAGARRQACGADPSTRCRRAKFVSKRFDAARRARRQRARPALSRPPRRRGRAAERRGRPRPGGAGALRRLRRWVWAAAARRSWARRASLVGRWTTSSRRCGPTYAQAARAASSAARAGDAGHRQGQGALRRRGATRAGDAGAASRLLRARAPRAEDDLRDVRPGRRGAALAGGPLGLRRRDRRVRVAAGRRRRLHVPGGRRDDDRWNGAVCCCRKLKTAWDWLPPATRASRPWRRARAGAARGRRARGALGPRDGGRSLESAPRRFDRRRRRAPARSAAGTRVAATESGGKRVGSAITSPLTARSDRDIRGTGPVAARAARGRRRSRQWAASWRSDWASSAWGPP